MSPGLPHHGPVVWINPTASVPNAVAFLSPSVIFSAGTRGRPVLLLQPPKHPRSPCSSIPSSLMLHGAALPIGSLQP